jgi:adenylate cyclase class 2
MTEPLEIEVKFFLADIDSVRSRIQGLGAEGKGRVFESNLRFEDVEKSLYKSRSLLRLRKDNHALLTFKSESDGGGDFKVHRELEVSVGDFSSMKAILEALGFQVEQTYEKWRETFTLDQTTFCLDTMPYGDFLEIEGKPSDIRYFADKLGLDWKKRILKNYLDIFRLLKKEMNLGFTDVTFDNFETVHVDLTAFLDRLEAGKDYPPS